MWNVGLKTTYYNPAPLRIYIFIYATARMKKWRKRIMERVKKHSPFPTLSVLLLACILSLLLGSILPQPKPGPTILITQNRGLKQYHSNKQGSVQQTSTGKEFDPLTWNDWLSYWKWDHTLCLMITLLLYAML